MELLRILDVEGNVFETLPPKVGELIGLRYLILRGTRVRLPKWLDILKNLEILDIRDSHRVIFPNVNNRKMNSVRHFYFHPLSATNIKKESSWRNLETLSWIKVSDLHKINFSNHISKLGIINDTKTFLETVSATTKDNLVHLTALKLRGDDSVIDLPPSMDVDLTPSMDVLLPSLTHLTLSEMCTADENNMMHELSKLPNLLVLKLQAVRLARGNIGYSEIISTGFPKLKILHLTGLDWLCGFIKIKGGMPHLQQLQICECRRLRDIDMLKERIKPAELIILD